MAKLDKLDIQRLRRKDTETIANLYARCVHWSRVGSRTQRMGDFADDIAQEMALKILSPDFLDRFGGEMEIDAWMVEYAKRAAMGLRRKQRWNHETGSEGLEDEPAGDPAPEETVDDERQAIRAEAAKQMLRQIEHGRRTSAMYGKHPAPERKNRITRWQRAMREREGVQEISNWCNRLGLTHQQAARVLGVSVHHLRGVLYGRVSGRPSVMVKQLSAFAQSQEDMPEPIGEQMRRWRDRMGLGNEPGWHLTLAEALGIHRSTVYRWKTGKSTPPAGLVRFLDALVDAQAPTREETEVTGTPPFGDPAMVAGRNGGASCRTG